MSTESDPRLAEQKYKTIIHAAMNGFWLADANGRFIDVNEAYCRMSGYSRAELLSMGISDVEAGTRDGEKHIRRIIERGHDRFETRHIRKDGAVIDVEVSANYLNESGGQLFVFIRDITERKRMESSLRTLSNAVEQSLSLVVITDREGVIQYVNRQFSKTTGYAPEDVIGKKPSVLKSGKHPPEFYRELWDTIASGNVWSRDICNRKKNGELYWELRAISPIKNDKGDIMHYLGVQIDDTERKSMENALRRSEASLREAQQIAHIGNWDWDIVRNIMYWSDEVYNIFGLELRNSGPAYASFLSSVHPDDREFVDRSVKEALHESKDFDIDCRIVSRESSIKVVHCKGRAIFDDLNRPVRMTGTVQDVTERKLLEEELKRRAVTDGLTNAYNRVKFNEVIKGELGRARRYKRPLSLSIFDIDDFKRVNDAFGHTAGDSVLITVANIVKKNIRETSYLFRWGGEEFVILLPETTVEGARVQAERIRNGIAAHRFEQVGRVTVSFGLTQFRDDDTADSFLKRADEAMYKVKTSGKNRTETAE